MYVIDNHELLSWKAFVAMDTVFVVYNEYYWP